MNQNPDFYFYEYIDNEIEKSVEQLDKDRKVYSNETFKVVGFAVDNNGRSRILVQVFDGDEFIDY